MMTESRLQSPFRLQDLGRLVTGQNVLLNGVIYTARDAAHRKIAGLLEQGQALPVELAGQTIYYMGPTPPRPGRIIGSCGPTTSSRMDVYTERLLEIGILAMIGKGARSAKVKKAMMAHQAIYLVTYGGAGALLSQCIKNAQVVAFPELGAEAMMRLDVEDFPAVVAVDVHGVDLFDR